MTITLEKLGNSTYGFAGLGDCSCDAFNTDCDDGTACTPLPVTTAPLLNAGSTPAITSGIPTCGAGLTLDPNTLQCIGLFSTQNLANAPSSIQGSYYTTGGNLVVPGSAGSSVPVGSYAIVNPTTGVTTIATSAPVNLGNTAAAATSLISGISNTTLFLGVAVAVLLIAITEGAGHR